MCTSIVFTWWLWRCTCNDGTVTAAQIAVEKSTTAETVAFPAAGPAAQLPMPLPPSEHVNCTARTLAVPKQGSPNVVVLGKTLQACWPIQAAETTDVEFAALQGPTL